jgi:S1-C subfamily serine protease
MKSFARFPLPSLLLVATLAAGCGGPGAWVRYDEVEPLPNGGADVTTLVDFGRRGVAVAEAYLEAIDRTQGTDLIHVRESVKSSCVRVRAYGAASGRLALGSGVLVREGAEVLAVTAGHVFEAFFSEDVAAIEVVLVDGTIVEAELQDLRSGTASRDWARLRLRDVEGRPLAPAPVAEEVRRGDRVFLLGYPDHLGEDARGEIAHGLTLPADAFLEPLPLVGRVDHVDPLLITPVAGAMPLSGASGSPFFNERGEAIGCLTATTRTPERNGITFVLQATPLAR